MRSANNREAAKLAPVPHRSSPHILPIPRSIACLRGHLKSVQSLAVLPCYRRLHRACAARRGVASVPHSPTAKRFAGPLLLLQQLPPASTFFARGPLGAYSSVWSLGSASALSYVVPSRA